MIKSSPVLALIAISLSALMHMSGLYGFWEAQESVQMAGGTPQPVARLGNSFRDVATGVLEARESSEEILPEEITEHMQAERPQTEIAPVQSMQIEAVVSKPLPPAQTAALKPLAIPPSVPLAVTTDMPQIKPAEIAPVEPAILEPIEEDTSKLTTSVRPPSTRPKPRPKPQGNTTANVQQESAGASDGQAHSNSAQRSQSNAQAKPEAGNAAMSNYMGQVRRKIDRAQRRTSFRGRATVQFTLSANGKLTSLKITKSTGSTRYDNAALQIIRRAAPFPKNPLGKPHVFTIAIGAR